MNGDSATMLALVPLLFRLILAAHIGAGVTALGSFWVAVAAAKGGKTHRRWGRIFANAVYSAGFCALGMALLSLYAPLANHPQLTDEALYRGLFGWMMLYLALLTISMTRYGLVMVANKRHHDANRHWSMIALQLGVLVTGANCAIQGVVLRQPLMIGISVVGFGTTFTYLWYLSRRDVPRGAWLPEHLKAMVATGISSYTAFLSVGLIEMFPQHAFNPAIWVIPTIIGVGIIGYFLRKLRPRPGAASCVASRVAGGVPSASNG